MLEEEINSIFISIIVLLNIYKIYIV